MRRHANEKFDSKSVMKSSYCEWNIDIDETIILCSEKDTLWLCVLYQDNWKYAEMFEKSALLIICCDISTKSFENVPIACENSTKPIKTVLSGFTDTQWRISAENVWTQLFLRLTL